MVQTSKTQTCLDGINVLLNESVMLLPELLIPMQGFIEDHKQLGFMTKEDSYVTQ